MDRLFEFLKENDLNLIIEGHTDNIGSDAYNKELSESRAQAVFEYLLKKGIDPARMTYEGYGSSRPLRENDSELNRAMNRRVEVSFE